MQKRRLFYKQLGGQTNQWKALWNPVNMYNYALQFYQENTRSQTNYKKADIKTSTNFVDYQSVIAMVKQSNKPEPEYDI